jgi:hypothetical protein
MKTLLAIITLALFAGNAKADTLDTVSLSTSVYANSATPSHESIGLTFNWDVTTQALSGFQFTTDGPYSFNPTPTAAVFTPNGIDMLIFNGPSANLEISIEGIGSGTVIPSAPGTYDSPVWFACAGCVGHDVADSTTIVTDPMSLPEPGTLGLLAIGLAFTCLVFRVKA